MGKKYSLSIGLNKVDPASYDGEWDGALACCEKDAKDMNNIASDLSYDRKELLLTKNATRENVIKTLEAFSKDLQQGDYFLFYYSGHGGQVMDENSDEDDDLDETWCLYNGELIDDEIYYYLSRFSAGVRIYVLSDSCHSGTVIKAAVRKSSPEYIQKRNLIKSMPANVAIKSNMKRKKFYEKIQKEIGKKKDGPIFADGQWSVKASVKLLSGCQDNQESGASPDEFHNSDFTDRLLLIWKGGTFNNIYQSFHSKVISIMPSNQTPKVFSVGPEDPDFDRQAPFTNKEAAVYFSDPQALKYNGVTLIKIGSKGPLVKKWQEFLTGLGYSLGKADGDFGNKTFRATIEFQKKYNLKADGIAGKNTFDKAMVLGFKFPEEQTIDPGTGKGITRDQLAYIMRGAKSADIDTFLEPMNKVMTKYEINTPLRICHFLAQVGHESGSLRYKEEIASGRAYEGRADLGNIKPGDGIKYKGHGLIQLTGRSNHTDYAKYTGDPDLIENPRRIALEPEHSAGAAAWFWMTRKLNPLADQDDIMKITKRINGGYNGLEDRKGYLQRAKKVII